MGSFTDLFIRRPVLATVVSLLILLVGLQCGFRLQIRQYPELSQTTLTITTTYPGANADLIKGFITTPIEQAVASAEGIDTIVSSSQQNASTITLNLRLNANPDRAMTDVLSKVNQVKSVLPREANDPVVVKKTGQGFALMYLSFNSATLSPAQITDYLTRVIQPGLQTIDGVGDAQILGGQTFAMRVWLDPERMAARNITPSDVRNALTANNFTSAAGQIKGDWVQTSINALTSLDSAQAFSQLVVSARGDALTRIGDIAKVELGPESVDSSSVFDGLKAVFIGVYATPTANPLDMIDNVRKAYPGLKANLPSGLESAIAYDATEFIRASIWEVGKTLGEAALIVVLVIFLFLGDLRSTLIPIVTIPLSLIGVMIMLLMLGYSINLLTLLALVLAIGLVVDDAIVVVENIYRHIEEGLTPRDAALKGAREIAMPVISMTITLAGSVFVSGVIALTLSPMMCSKLLKPHAGAEKAGFAGFLDRMFERLRLRYERRLHRTLNFRAMTVLILFGVLGLTAVIYMSTQRELAPEEDQGFIISILKAPQYANLNYMEQTTDEFNKKLKSVSELAHSFAINGTGGPQQAFAGLILKPWGDRSRSQKEVLQSLQPLLQSLPGVSTFAIPPPALPGSSGGAPVQFIIRTTADYKQLAQVLADIQQDARASGLFIFTDSDLKFDTPQFQLKIDSDKANRLGVSMQDVGSALATLLGGNYVNRFSLYGRSYQVIPQAPRDYRLTVDWLLRYQVRTATGDLVPLSTIATVSQTVQPNALTSFQQLSSATLSGVPFPGHTIGETVDFLKREAAEKFPDGYTYDWQGDARQFVQEGDTLTLTFIFALIVIFLVLAAQFESFRDPLIILIALPTSMFGAMLPMLVASMMPPGVGGPFAGLTMNIYSQIGLVTLIGLISKHGILMVDFANQMRERDGLGKREAIEHAAGVRLRPILMTTAAMVVGMIPLIIADGAGARSRIAIGMVIAFGMAIGTLFTLFVTPAIYTMLAHDVKAAPAGGALAQAGGPEVERAAE